MTGIVLIARDRKSFKHHPVIILRSCRVCIGKKLICLEILFVLKYYSVELFLRHANYECKRQPTYFGFIVKFDKTKIVNWT